MNIAEAVRGLIQQEPQVTKNGVGFTLAYRVDSDHLGGTFHIIVPTCIECDPMKGAVWPAGMWDEITSNLRQGIDPTDQDGPLFEELEDAIDEFRQHLERYASIILLIEEMAK